MLDVVMEPDVIKGLGPLADQYTHNKALAYFEQIKASDQGLEFCATAISQGSYREDYINFFLWQVLEHQIKVRQLPDSFKTAIRNTLLAWLQTYSKKGLQELPAFVRNKAAQVFSIAFAKEYLVRWSTFTQDIMLMLLGDNPTAKNINDQGVDLYLRILLAIDSEVVDRSIVHTEEEKEHNQLLKDIMRERSINEMVDSWFCILTSDQTSKSSKAMCLQVVGAYITWIDIGLVANDRFMSLILSYLSSLNAMEIREAACDCVREIALKGMLPMDKLSLIETLWGAILSSGILNVLNDDEEIDFVIKLSRLVASMASTLIQSWNRMVKPTPDVVKTEEGLNLLASAIHNKIPTCMKFFEHDDDDVSAQCIDFMRDYIDMQKHTQPFDNSTKEILKEIFCIIIKKLKYDEEYRFNNEGEDEAEFQDFLRNIKVIYDNFAILCPNIVLTTVYDLLVSTLPQWQAAAFNDVEVSIRALYMLGESLPSNMSFQFSPDKQATSPIHRMMALLVSSGVSGHPHSAVRLQFFETVSRYDRYFPAASNIIEEKDGVAATTEAFLDQRGLHSDDPKIRSRCAYLFSRFVKTIGKQLSQFAEEILTQIQDLVVLSPINSTERVLSCEDQLFIYELAGNLIVNSSFPPEKKASLMTALLRPLVEEFQPLLLKMRELHAREENMPKNVKRESEICANTLNYAMSYASRTSKAFSNKQTMGQSGCSKVYTDALKVFLQALDTDIHRKILHTGVRQYLHRMVICLEDEVLPFVPITVRHLLSNQESHSLHDFIPLINQIVNKFKKLIEPFLHEVFMLVVRSVFAVLSHHNGEEVNGTISEDTKIIRRSYFQFLHGLVTNGVASVILTQDTPDVEMVLSTLIEGASNILDPIAEKICFTVLIRIIQAWDDTSINISLESFICSKVIPVCFLAPLNPKFDMSDAQAIIALNESASLLKAMIASQAVEVEAFLRQQYLPSLQLPLQVIEEYCQALKTLDTKGFRAYLKVFYRRRKS